MKTFNPKDQKGKGNLLNQITTFENDPNEFAYSDNKVLPIGNSAIFAILALDSDYAIHYKCVKVKKIITKDNESKEAMFDVIYPDERADELFDADGTPLSSLQQRDYMKVPILYIGKTDAAGKLIEYEPSVKYVTLKPSLVQAVKKLSENVADGLQFDNIPDYLVRIDVVKGNKGIPKNYELKDVRGELKFNNKRVFPPNFRFDDTLEALAEVVGIGTDDLYEEITQLCGAMQEYHTKQSTFDAVKRQCPSQDGDEKKSVSLRDKPVLGKRAAEAAAMEEPVEGTETEEKEEETQPTGGSRFQKLRGR